MSTVGAILRALRDATGLSQRDFATHIGLDQSRVSRIENGAATPTDDELDAWLGASGKQDAERARTWLHAPWQALDEPPPRWNHPDIATLATAAEAVQRLVAADAPENVRSSVERYRRELLADARSLRCLEYRASLVGATAVGKSTAEAYGLDLRTPNGEPILATGGGSTTLCEVLIEQADNWGILVEPEPMEEVHRLVEDLCWSFKPRSERPADERPAVPSEVRAALLNMADLAPQMETGPDGQSIRRERLRELAEQEGERLSSTFLIRLRLTERSQIEMWWDPGMPGDPSSWLRDNLRKINKGLHPSFSLPRQIRLMVARRVLDEGPFDVTVLDTRGIASDNVVRRPDLADSLADPRTITVLCSSFLNAPDLYVRKLLQYADEQEFASWRDRVALLLLARPSEPMQVRYEDTDELVDTPDDGIQIKEAHTRQQLAEIDCDGIPVVTYNALHDAPSRFRSVVLDRIRAMRAQMHRRVEEAAAASAVVLANAMDHAARVARRAVARELLLLLDGLDPLVIGSGRPQDVLLSQVSVAHPRSVWAMARRRGLWRTLSLDLHLSDGAAQVVRGWSREPITKLAGALERLGKRTELKEAGDLIQQLTQALAAARTDFVARSRAACHATIWSPMHADLQLWADCEATWLQGAGYRSRVVDRLGRWFQQNAFRVEDFDKHAQLAWSERFMKPLRDLCGSSELPEGTSDQAAGADQ